MQSSCVLCDTSGGRLLWENDTVRIINAEDPAYPAFTRVIYQHHVQEMSDLSRAQRHALMDYVFLVEEVQRQVLAPTKINLAQFGTMVPHIHWHIIPRFSEDPHYPDAIWAALRRPLDAAEVQHYLKEQQQRLQHYEETLVAQLRSISHN